jgi:hypothetical protein
MSAEYAFLLRSHYEDGFDTVFYAVPRHRLLDVSPTAPHQRGQP